MQGICGDHKKEILILNNAALEKGAYELLKRYPEKEALVIHYLEAQKRESQIIEQDLGIGLWVIQKGLN